MNHKHHTLLALLVTILAGGILLPLVRSEPESVHEFFLDLNDWQRIGFIFFLALAFTYSMFQLLAPRLMQLRYWWKHPPAWLGVSIAVIVVAIVDLTIGLDPRGYRATVWEWLGYAGGSVFLVGWHLGTWQELTRVWPARKTKATSEEVEPIQRLTLEDIESAPWSEIEEWLQSDAPAKYDFLGNRSLAERLATMITDGTRSIGIVGPYGAGKTSLVHWIHQRLDGSETQGQRFFVCRHSCWGFETSASAIHDMLDQAVQKIGEEIDTFHVKSLPESYRQTFSASGNWVDAISNVVLTDQNPLDQFSRLSALLSDLNAKLVFVVEDLDRSETQNFEIQEVLAFLERLKQYRNLTFILTGGELSILTRGELSSRQIDFAKLTCPL